MGVVLVMMLRLLKLCIIIGFSVAVQGSKGSIISPSPALVLPVIPSRAESPGPLHPKGSWTTIAPSSPAIPNGTFLQPPIALPLPAAAPTPQNPKDIEPFTSPSPSATTLSPPNEIVPSPSMVQGNMPPPLEASPPQRNAPAVRPPFATQIAPAPVAAVPSGRPANNSPVSQPTEHGALAPSIDNRNANQTHTLESVPPSPVAAPSSNLPKNSSGSQPTEPITSAPAAVNLPKISPAGQQTEHGNFPSVVHHQRSANTSHNLKPVSPESAASPPSKVEHEAPVAHPIFPSITPSVNPAPVASPISTPSRSFHWKKGGAPPIAAPSHRTPKPLPAVIHPPAQDQAIPSSIPPTSGQTHHVSPAMTQGSTVPPVSSIHSPMNQVPSTPSPTIKISPPPTEMQVPSFPPKVSPPSPKTPLPPPVQALTPPPPNEGCLSTVCLEPYTNSPPGAPCRCVWPMRVGLRLSVSLYTFFPLVSELASEIAKGIFMKQSQVRIMGASAANEQPDKTVVLINLVPLGENFDSTTAFFTSDRFWHKRVVIKASYFGDYDVLYVSYPGLPPSPPLPPSTITMIDGGPYSIDGNNGGTIKPIGVDIQKQQHKNGLSRGIIAIIVVSVLLAVVFCAAASWAMFKLRGHVSQPASTPRVSQPSLIKATGAAAPSIIGGRVGSSSTSFRSSIAAYTGSAKTFSANEIEKATDNFHASRILGEGGFGLVYSGTFEDGTKVAVKVLKREDHHGDCEFLAEVEMLSRLHHRNLVKLIGICAEETFRCLVYELIPNGSVESHLHGVDKEISPLDWDSRLKVALGAARGLAYLHEDSSPRVIHRDFKSSNILLENDFTPKVSDFGLARTATDEENRHVSTRVMGTFGYVAPEYAMTGHLLVKSDVYSYGVVLLELLTGSKPVDMSQPPGQENLVSWARPLLTSREGLEAIIDPSLGSDVPFDSVAKVAAIASMCVQPEVSNRPFMGEVVQALKLVCNECDEAKDEAGSRSSSLEGLSVDLDVGVSNVSGQIPDSFQSQQFTATNFGSGLDVERALSASELFSSSARFGREESGSFRRHSYSGPLITGRSRQLWQIMRKLSGGTVSEHGSMFKL